jgi:hypothetical protein
VPSADEKNKEKELQQFSLTQRRALNNALGSLLGSDSSQKFQSFTFEEAVDARIERIEGQSSVYRPSELDRVDRIENELLKTVEELKQVSDEKFQTLSEEENVNTPE